MNIRKDKLDMFKTVYLAMKPHLKDILSEEQRLILHLYLFENKGLMEIAEQLNFDNYHIVKEELKVVELKISALG